ncbi:FHA domain-containing protein [Paenibacillus hexagrammi]|uniref:FHA domain-containing protein n=1 Tax=Paenibacillus hexagrammi TaxID=2908839 RepID=A0ABY3SFI7_9BACL|nr:FHA domain-containing protein [Paenibacillus sp. YPD9-1]UJF32220.1 FHA domain-containing protein [Paenibacillus sp. YPD9-1]
MKVATGFYWIKVIDALLILITLGAAVYVYGFNRAPLPKIIGGTAVAIAVVGFLAVRWLPKLMAGEEQSAVSKLALLDEEEEVVHEWPLHGYTSLLIGKSSVPGEVDINLFEAEYASLISKQHAVLNLVAGNWFVEDIHSRNGVGIKKVRQPKKRKLEVEEPHLIEIGDVIYIANTRLLVQ